MIRGTTLICSFRNLIRLPPSASFHHAAALQLLQHGTSCNADETGMPTSGLHIRSVCNAIPFLSFRFQSYLPYVLSQSSHSGSQSVPEDFLCNDTGACTPLCHNLYLFALLFIIGRKRILVKHFRERIRSGKTVLPFSAAHEVPYTESRKQMQTPLNSAV